MTVRVKLHGRLRIAAGTGEIMLDEPIGNVGELLDKLTRMFGSEIQKQMFVPTAKDLSPNLVVLVNGHSIRLLQGLSTSLTLDSTVTIDSIDVMEIVGGG